MFLSRFQMVWLPEFRSHSKSRPFATQTLLDHSKSRLGWISDPHCTRLVIYLDSYSSQSFTVLFFRQIQEATLLPGNQASLLKNEEFYRSTAEIHQALCDSFFFQLSFYCKVVSQRLKQKSFILVESRPCFFYLSRLNPTN